MKRALLRNNWWLDLVVGCSVFFGLNFATEHYVFAGIGAVGAVVSSGFADYKHKPEQS